MATDRACEAQIAERLAARDLSAAATIGIRAYGAELLGYLTAVLHDEADAADAFSQCCEDIWRGVGDFRSDASFKTWAYKLAWHAALRLLRDPRRRRGRALGTAEAEALVAEVRATTALHLKTEAKDAFAAIRETLEPEEQTLLVLRIDRGLAWAEIAEVLAPQASSPRRTLGSERSQAALRKRFERVKEKVRREAVARGLIEE
jgi:RNA polymerase sigma-70 factor (ECF subfamily)